MILTMGIFHNYLPVAGVVRYGEGVMNLMSPGR